MSAIHPIAAQAIEYLEERLDSQDEKINKIIELLKNNHQLIDIK